MAVTDLTSDSPNAAVLAARTLHRRAVEAVIWGMPAVNYDLMLQAMLTKTSGQVNQVIYWGRPLDWHNQTLTPNPDTLYFMAFLNTADVGPIVIDIPAADADGSLNANLVNVWQEPQEDAGLLGVDRGAGVKLLMLPPNYEHTMPDGYAVLRPGTWGSYVLFRSNIDSHSAAAVAASLAYGKKINVYPLSQASDPPPTTFVDVQDVDFDSTIRYDPSFFNGLDRIVQAEPWFDRDRPMIDYLKTLGIEKGKPFSPTAETQHLLGAAAREAQLVLAARYDNGLTPYYEGSHWNYPAPPELIKAAQNGFSDPDDYPIDSRGLAYHYAYIGLKRLGVGQFYMISIKDAAGENFDGSKEYRLTVPPGAPVEQYWSVTAYDRSTHALIKNVNRASRASNDSKVQSNADGSVDIYFGPQSLADQESNWVPTDPAGSFELMFRLYAPTTALFDKTWQLPDVTKT
jgi:hypothetical protein